MSVPKENRWQLIDHSARCEPTDWLTMITARDLSTQLNFLWNRTIVLFGDSVDRDHNWNFCEFVNGTLEMIGASSPLSPPYPDDEQIPPVGCVLYNVHA